MTRKADWRGILTIMVTLGILAIVLLVKPWLAMAHWVFESPGPEAVALGTTLVFLVIAFAYSRKLRRIGATPPSRRISLRFLGPLDVYVEQAGYGAMVYACLRGMKVITTETLDLQVVDRVSVGAALGLLLFLAVSQPLKDLRATVTLQHAVLVETAAKPAD